MKQKVKEFRQIAQVLCQQYEKKNEDYGDSFGQSVKKYGKTSMIVRISDKFHRLERLLLGGKNNVGEKLEDTLGDLASYCIMSIIELNAMKKTEKEELPEMRSTSCVTCENWKDGCDLEKCRWTMAEKLKEINKQN